MTTIRNVAGWNGLPLKATGQRGGILWTGMKQSVKKAGTRSAEQIRNIEAVSRFGLLNAWFLARNG
jgi:hypothetical protein